MQTQADVKGNHFNEKWWIQGDQLRDCLLDTISFLVQGCIDLEVDVELGADLDAQLDRGPVRQTRELEIRYHRDSDQGLSTRSRYHKPHRRSRPNRDGRLNIEITHCDLVARAADIVLGRTPKSLDQVGFRRCGYVRRQRRLVLRPALVPRSAARSRGRRYCTRASNAASSRSTCCSFAALGFAARNALQAAVSTPHTGSFAPPARARHTLAPGRKL